MEKFVSGYHLKIHELMSLVHRQLSRSNKNRYQIGEGVLVNYSNGKACEVYIDHQGVRYFNPETMQFDLQVLQTPTWPAFSIVDATACFESVLRRQIPLIPSFKPKQGAKKCLCLAIQQIIEGKVNADDLRSNI